MASGDNVVRVIRELSNSVDAATLDARYGGSTPSEIVRVYDFDAAVAEYMDFLCMLSGYDGGGLTFRVPYSMSSAVSSRVVWSIAIRRFQDDAEDIDAAHAYDFNSVTDVVPNVAGEISYPAITFTDGADMDNWAEGELAIVRLMRDADNPSDDAAGDAELWSPPIGLES